MMEHKRSPVSLEESSIVSFTTSKRHKGDISITSKMKKEKFGERIQALQQLVSPYGKTDTASVLLQAMEYISFLHEQVKVLSSPYLESTSDTETQCKLTEMIANLVTDSWSRIVGMLYSLSLMKGWELSTLRNKGLCLVPIPLTIGLVSNNGADIWAPIKTITRQSRRLVSDEPSQQKTCVSKDYSLFQTSIFGSNHEINQEGLMSKMCDQYINTMYEIAVPQDNQDV